MGTVYPTLIKETHLPRECGEPLAEATSIRPCVYILASRKHGTLYIGPTSNVRERLDQHRSGSVRSFTHKYRVSRLVYVEFYETLDEARSRERQMKKWRREWKIRLIESINPDWSDIAAELPF
ncbi:MAG: GIY-YIG nuclease family protein [Hyphomicrobiales bacterium]|nr:GIY-YIG nuclease family protein [Hyphomicrobiales bacterium]